MDHTKASLMKLNKEDLVCLLLDCQGKFNSILDDLKNNFDELKTKFAKLEADLNILDRLINVERKCFANEQYSRTECLEISGIPPSVKDNELETKVLTILEEINAPVDPGLVEDCHHLPSKGNPKKVILKLNLCRDARKVLLNKKKFKNLDSETVNLHSGTKIYINESLSIYYKKLWSKCKKLWDAKHILSFWVSNGLMRVKLKNEAVSIIMHNCDLANLFPDNLLIDNY